jgi:hypothetical protein
MQNPAAVLKAMDCKDCYWNGIISRSSTVNLARSLCHLQHCPTQLDHGDGSGHQNMLAFQDMQNCNYNLHSGWKIIERTRMRATMHMLSVSFSASA